NVSDPQPTTHPTSGAQGIVFTYQTVQPQIGNTTLVRTTWQVKSNSPQSVQEALPLDNTPDVRAGDPENGISIKKIETLDASGNVIGPGFSPITGLLMLSLPVYQGDQITSTAADPVTGMVA